MTGLALLRGLFTLTLLVLFVGSGCAALIYEVVWLQLLQLVIGSTAVSCASSRSTRRSRPSRSPCATTVRPST